MKHLLAAIVIMSGVFPAFSQSIVYTDQYRSYGNMVLTVKNGFLFAGMNDFPSDALYTVQDNSIYKGYSTSVFDVLYTVRDGQLYTGEGRLTDTLLMTVKNGKVYKGDSTMPLDCVFTYQQSTNTIYVGDSTFPLDAKLFIDGEILRTAELFAVLIALDML